MREMVKCLLADHGRLMSHGSLSGNTYDPTNSSVASTPVDTPFTGYKSSAQSILGVPANAEYGTATVLATYEDLGDNVRAGDTITVGSIIYSVTAIHQVFDGDSGDDPVAILISVGD